MVVGSVQRRGRHARPREVAARGGACEQVVAARALGQRVEIDAAAAVAREAHRAATVEQRVEAQLEALAGGCVGVHGGSPWCEPVIGVVGSVGSRGCEVVRKRSAFGRVWVLRGALRQNRAVPSDEPLLLRFHPFELDERQARLTRDGRPLAVAPKAFEVLCALARSAGQLVRKDELLDAVWGHRHVSESVLKTIVSELRAALGDDAKRPRFIETASRRGYRFIAPLQAPGAARVATLAPPASIAAPVTMPESTLIGREAARQQLHAAWRAASGGRRQIVWLTGEAGIGKTTLIEHVMGELADQATLAHGQCVEQHG